MNKKQITISDWIQYLEHKTKSFQNFGIICFAIFFSFMTISLALSTTETSNNVLILLVVIGIQFVLLFFIFFIFSFKPSLLLNKIMKSDKISVETIRKEWYSKKSTPITHLLKNFF